MPVPCRPLGEKYPSLLVPRVCAEEIDSEAVLTSRIETESVTEPCDVNAGGSSVQAIVRLEKLDLVAETEALDVDTESTLGAGDEEMPSSSDEFCDLSLSSKCEAAVDEVMAEVAGESGVADDNSCPMPAVIAMPQSDDECMYPEIASFRQESRACSSLEGSIPE